MIALVYVLVALAVTPLVAYHVLLWHDMRRMERAIAESIRRSKEQSRKVGLLP